VQQNIVDQSEEGEEYDPEEQQLQIQDAHD
jgi:hypothetical protein